MEIMTIWRKQQIKAWNKSSIYRSRYETVAVLLHGFAINKTAAVSWPDPYDKYNWRIKGKAKILLSHDALVISDSNQALNGPVEDVFVALHCIYILVDVSGTWMGRLRSSENLLFSCSRSTPSSVVTTRWSRSPWPMSWCHAEHALTMRQCCER